MQWLGACLVEGRHAHLLRHVVAVSRARAHAATLCSAGVLEPVHKHLMSLQSGSQQTVLQDSDRFWRVTPPARAALIAVLSEPGAELALAWQVCPPDAHAMFSHGVSVRLMSICSCLVAGGCGCCSCLSEGPRQPIEAVSTHCATISCWAGEPQRAAPQRAQRAGVQGRAPRAARRPRTRTPGGHAAGVN